MNLNNLAIRSPRLLTAAAGALLASVALATPASAAVKAGHSVTMFHNSDFVAATGYSEADSMTVDVLRRGVRIGTATGTPAATPDGAGLEVNHGPAGAPQPGDCWNNTTPDVLPGDEVRVTYRNAGVELGVDSTTVADVNFTGAGPRELANGDIVIDGFGAIAGDQLAGEVRVGPAFRAFGDVENVAGAWQAVYRAPGYGVNRNRDGADVKQSILNGDHSVTYAPTAGETTIAERGANGGPGPGCEGSPREANAIAAADDTAVNIASGSLVLSGVARAGTTAVRITVSSDNGGSVSQDATVSGGTFQVDIPRAQVDTLDDGTLTASGQFSDAAGATIGGASLRIQKDTVAPAAATATPAPGIYQRAQSVSLNAETGADVRYTLDGSTPTRTSTLYSGQIQVTASQTIKAIAFDRAGNGSTAASFAYVIDAPGLREAPATPAIPAQPQGAGIPAIPAIRASISGLRSVSAVRLATARRSGIAASFSSNGVASVQLRLYSLKGGRKLVTTQRVGLADGPHSVRLASRSMRKRLASGRYLLEVSTAGKVIRTSIRIVA